MKEIISSPTGAQVSASISSCTNWCRQGCPSGRGFWVLPRLPNNGCRRRHSAEGTSGPDMADPGKREGRGPGDAHDWDAGECASLRRGRTGRGASWTLSVRPLTQAYILGTGDEEGRRRAGAVDDWSWAVNATTYDRSDHLSRKIPRGVSETRELAQARHRSMTGSVPWRTVGPNRLKRPNDTLRQARIHGTTVSGHRALYYDTHHTHLCDRCGSQVDQINPGRMQR